MKLIRSFAFAFNGFKICFTSETNFKIHVLLAVVAATLGIVFKLTSGEWLIILFCMALVISMEMMNTAVERLCDAVDTEFSPGIKIIKDMAAGAVLVAAVFSLITGLIIFIPKIVMYLNSL